MKFLTQILLIALLCAANRGSAWPNSSPIARIWPLLGAWPTIGSLVLGAHQGF